MFGDIRTSLSNAIECYTLNTHVHCDMKVKRLEVVCSS